MAETTMKLEGLDEALLALNKRISEIDHATIGGLLAGGLIIQRDSQEHVPVEYGKLRASAYTRKTPENEHTVEVGYSADYALYVHENIEVNAGKPRASGLGVLWGPHGEPKFLENAVNRKQDEVVETIKRYASVASATGTAPQGESE